MAFWIYLLVNWIAMMCKLVAEHPQRRAQILGSRGAAVVERVETIRGLTASVTEKRDLVTQAMAEEGRCISFLYLTFCLTKR